MARTVTLAQRYRRFAEEAAETAPLQARTALALSASDESLRVIEAAPARQRYPAVVLAALYDLALAGRTPRLAAAYEDRDAEAAARAAVETLVSAADAVWSTAGRHPVRPDEGGHYAVLYPLIAEAARQAGAEEIGLVDVGRAGGLNLNVDRVAATYGNGQSLGDPRSPVAQSASVVGSNAIPERPLPDVVTRIAVGSDPFDVTDPDDVRWLTACVGPDHPERSAALAAELGLAASAPPQLVRGDPVEALPDALAQVPSPALPVVMTTWALSRLPVERRRRLLQSLEQAASQRRVAWVSVEGVGVAPAVPTLGDRPASGHSLLGVVLVDRSGVCAKTVGRCWSRGRLLSWLAES